MINKGATTSRNSTATLKTTFGKVRKLSIKAYTGKLQTGAGGRSLSGDLAMNGTQKLVMCSKRPQPGELRPPIRAPDGGGRVPVGCSLRSTPPSTGESKPPSRESFPEPLLIGQRAVIGGEALNTTF